MQTVNEAGLLEEYTFEQFTTLSIEAADKLERKWRVWEGSVAMMPQKTWRVQAQPVDSEG